MEKDNTFPVENQENRIESDPVAKALLEAALKEYVSAQNGSELIPTEVRIQKIKNAVLDAYLERDGRIDGFNKALDDVRGTLNSIVEG